MMKENFIIEFKEPEQILFHLPGEGSFLRITKDNFYLNGEEIKLEKENAQKLFDAMMAFYGHLPHRIDAVIQEIKALVNTQKKRMKEFNENFDEKSSLFGYFYRDLKNLHALIEKNFGVE